MSELGIFIDESGVFDLDKTFNNNLKDFYIVSFVFIRPSKLIFFDIL